MRQAMKLVRRLASIVTIGALDDSGLADLIRETFDAAAAAQGSP
jgi:hypothetical protein